MTIAGLEFATIAGELWKFVIFVQKMSRLKVFSCFCFGFEVGAADCFLALEGFFWMLYAHVMMHSAKENSSPIKIYTSI
jgi:hypothetical protein